MNLHSLLHYVVKHPDTRVSVSLKQLASEVLQNTDKKPELLCDFSLVAKWVLSSHDREQVRCGKLSPYCTLYGGDLKAYRECILKFVESLEQAGVEPVFFIGGPPGSEKKEEFETKFDQYREDSLKMQERCASVEQVCVGSRFLQVAWSFNEAMSMQVQYVLRAADVCMINCCGDTLAEMVQYSRAHSSQVVGIVSRSMELVLNVPGVKIILPDVVGSIVTVKALTDESCPAVSSESLARALGLRENQLADLATLICGCGCSLLAELGLDDNCGVESVAKWLQDQEKPIAELYPQCKELVGQIQNQSLILASEEKCVPEAQLNSHESTSTDDPSENSDKTETTLPKSLAEVIKVKVQTGVMLPNLLSMVEGRYWRNSAVELASLGQPCINDLTLALRMSLYSLMGLEKVTEYGRTSARTFDTIPLQLKARVACGVSQLKALGERTKNERLSLLFDLVSNPQRYRDCTTNLKECISTAYKIGSEIDKPISGKAVVVCASLLLLFQANTVLSSFSSLSYFELDALLVTCLTCLADYPPYIHLCRPPVRAVSIAMHFSHILEQVYVLASYLGLLEDLPAPASLFCSMAYVPYHMAGCSEVSSSHFDSSNLTIIQSHFFSLSNLEPVIAFQAEIVNGWKDPNLSSFLERFSSSLEAVATYKTQLKEKEGAMLNSTEGGGLSLSMEWTRDLDLSSSVDSNASSVVKCSELSSAQDYIATEEELFFAALFDDVNGDTVDDVIDRNDDIIGEDIFDDDIIFSISDTEQQLINSDSNKALTATTGSAPESVETANNETQQEISQDSIANPKSTRAVVDTAPPDSATLDEDVICSQPSTSSAPVSDSQSNSAASHRSYPHSRPPPSSAPPQPVEDRKELPVMAHREKILQLIHSHRVVCIEGETGCGKSTKIPQFILEDSLSSNPSTPCKILVTQPRRVAVIKLAERVAAERKERLGQTVGYCIGGERHRTSETSLTYCTVGYLLQALVHNPSMILRYTHIVLDEIHERSTDADFALIIVRKLVAASDNLKVIIMSATMEGHAIANYFEQAISFTEVADPYFVGAKRFTVNQYFIDELDQLVDMKKPAWSEWQAAASSNLKQLILQQPPENLQEALTKTPNVTLFAQSVCTELIISQANLGEQILVFLPGISEIATYYDMLNATLDTREIKDHFLVFVMHSQVPFEDQKEVFKPPLPNKAHIILATNIAESSITLPKLRMVVNFGIYRQLEYDSKRHMSQLIKKWCSQASCAQRAGRAGRVFDGVAIHLFTKRFYWVIIPEFDSPEILHAPLAKLVLQAKQIGSKMGIPLPSEFLSQAVDPPSLEQMELALNELASFGAIVSRPGLPVSEEAEITLLGRFALTLPLDIEFSRLVLYGIFFGVPTDAIVIAAAASLSQDVFKMPTRMIIKEDSIFSESLKRSMRTRCYFDGGQYSDSIMVCNLFREWIEYRNRCAMEEGLLSKHAFLHSFCSNRAVSWNRLLLLEHSVAEIASRILPHIPQEYHLYDDIRVLSDITNYRRGFNFTSDLEESSGRRQQKLRLSNVTLHFCDNTNTIKALLAASFAHNFIIGHRGVESPYSKEKKDSCHTLTVMSNLSYDPSETVTLRSDNTATSQDVQHLVSTVLSHRYCEVQLVDRIWYIHLHPEFSSNPKTALMRAQMGNQSEAEIPCVGGFLSNTSVIQQKLSLDMCYFWQYGERKPSWKVANATFAKPRHPLVVNWTRVKKEKETVILSEWRNPSGLICDLGLQCPPFLGVVSTMQGIQHRSAVSVRGVTILPSLANGKEALLMLLAFQSQAMNVDFLVSNDLIAGVMIDSFLLPLPMAHVGRISVNDIVRLNQLRQAMSKVMKTNVVSGSCLLPMEEMSSIHALLRCVLKGTPNLTKPLNRSSLHTKTGVISQLQDEDGTDSEFDFDPDDIEVTLDSFKFYPPLQCTLLDPVTCQSIPLESLQKDHLFQKKTNNGEGVRESVSPSSESGQAEELPLEQPKDPLEESKRQQQEELEHSNQSEQLLQSAPSQQLLEPGQLSVSHQLSMSDQLRMFQEQLHYQQLLEQQGGSFQLSPLAEPFVPNYSNLDSMPTSPNVSVAPYDQRTQERLPLHDVHNQTFPVEIPNVQHSSLHGAVQNLSVSKMQGSPVRSVPSMSFGSESFTGRLQLQPNIRPSQGVEAPCPDYRGSQKIPRPAPSPPPPSLPFDPYNIMRPDYPANLLSIIFHLLDKASCKPAGEGELEVQKAKLLCQRLMLISAPQLQLQSQLQPSLPHPFMQQDQSQHGGEVLPDYGPYPAPSMGRRENSDPPAAAIQTLPATTSLASKAPNNGRKVGPKSKDENAKNDVHPNEPIVPSADVKREQEDSVKEALIRPLRSPTTGLVEEHSEDQKSSGDVAGGQRNGDNVEEISPTEEVDLLESLESACETSPVQDGAPITSVMKTSPANSQESNIEKHSSSSPTENMADKTPSPTSPVHSQDTITEASPIIPDNEDPPSILIQEAQRDTEESISKTSSVSQLQEDTTNKISPTNSPQRDSLSPVATAAATSLTQSQQPKSQRHLSDPPASRNSGVPKIGTSQLTQALLSPPHHYPFQQAFHPPLPLSQLAALQSFNRPFSAFLSPPKRPSFSGQIPVPNSGGFLHHSAPAIPTHVFDPARQMCPSASFPSLSNSCAIRSLDFAHMISQPASVCVPPQGVCSPPNGSLLAKTAAVSNNGSPQRPHPPPPPPPGFTVPSPLSPQHEGQRSPPTGAQVSCAVEVSIPSQLPLPPQLPASTLGPQAAAAPLYRFVKVKDLNSSVPEDGLLAAPETFVTQAPLPPPHGHEHNTPGVTSSMPVSNRSRGRVQQRGRRVPAKKTPHHMQRDNPLPFRYQGPPLFPSQAHGSSNSANPSLLPPPPGLGWPLPPPPLPHVCQYGRHERIKAPPRPPSPHPDLIMNYTARHKASPLISALMPNPMHIHVQNYQASGLHVQSLEYNRCTNNNKMEKRVSVPSYEQFGIPGEQLMQYFCTMLATKGRDLELNLLCGPYYRDLLKCYRVCARENELLSPSFFEQYSCFTVYGEPGHFMVRLNPTTEESHMTEQNHMTGQDHTQSNTSDAPPDITKDGEEPTVKNNGDGNQETVASPSVVREEESVLVPYQEQKPVIVTIITGTTEIAEVPSSSRGDSLETTNADPERSTIECCHVSEEVTQKESEEKDDKVKSETMEDAQVVSESAIEETAAGSIVTTAGENWDEESVEINVQPPTPSVDSILPVSIATTTDSLKENWDEENEEINTEPVTSSTKISRPDNSSLPIPETDQSDVPVAGAAESYTMSEATVLAMATVKEGIPQPLSSRDKEVEIKEKESDVPDIPASTVSEMSQLSTGPSIEKDGDVCVEPVSGKDNAGDDKLPQISDVLSVSEVAELTLPTEALTTKDWDTTMAAEPITNREEIEDKQPLPVSLADEVSLPTESSTTEDWGATVELVTGGDMEQKSGEKLSLPFVASTSDIVHPDESSSKDNHAIPATPVTVEEEVEEKQSRDMTVSASEVTQLTETSSKEDWNVIPEQLSVPLATAADDHTSIEQTPASFTGYDEDCWVESEQLSSYIQSVPEQVAPSTQFESEEPKKEISSTVYDEDGWQENVVPEFVSIRRVECQPLRILKREEPPKRDEPIGMQWHERKPATSHNKGGATADSGRDRPEISGGGKKWKSKRKKKGKRGQKDDDRRERFSPAPQAEAKSTSGRAGKQSSSLIDKEQSSSSKDKEQSSVSSRDREQRPSSSRDSYRGQSSSSRDGYRGCERRQYLSEVKQRFKVEKEARDTSSDRCSNSSQLSKDDSVKRGHDGEGSRSGRRETREFYGGRSWYVRHPGQYYEYGSGWRQDKRRQEQKKQSETK